MHKQSGPTSKQLTGEICRPESGGLRMAANHYYSTRSAMVNFSGLEFMFRFLPVFLIVYSLIPSRYRDAVLFAGSLLFYASGTHLFVLLLLGLVVLNYLFGDIVWKMPGRRRQLSYRDQALAAAIAIDVGVLVLCKILALKGRASLHPLGLSFFIFKMISY